MAQAISPEALAKFRRLEARAKATSATIEATRHDIDHLRDVVGNLTGELQRRHARNKPARVEVLAGGGVVVVEGTVEHTDVEGKSRVTGGGRRVVAEAGDPLAMQILDAEEALAAALARQASAADGKPVIALVAACRETLRQAGWKGL